MGGRRKPEADDLMLSPVRLQAAEAVARRALLDLSPAARKFLKASREEVNRRGKAEKDTVARIAIGAGMAAIVLAIVAGVAVWQWDAATNAKALAESERDRAHAATETAIQSERDARAAARAASNFANTPCFTKTLTQLRVMGGSMTMLFVLLHR